MFLKTLNLHRVAAVISTSHMNEGGFGLFQKTFNNSFQLFTIH